MKSGERVCQTVREVIRWPGFIGSRSSLSIYYYLLLLLLLFVCWVQSVWLSQWLTEQSSPIKSSVKSKYYLILSRNPNQKYFFYPPPSLFSLVGKFSLLFYILFIPPICESAMKNIWSIIKLDLRWCKSTQSIFSFIQNKTLFGWRKVITSF